MKLFKVLAVARMYSVGAQASGSADLYVRSVAPFYLRILPTPMTLRAQLMTLAAASTAMVLLPLPQSAHREGIVGRTRSPRTF